MLRVGACVWVERRRYVQRCHGGRCRAPGPVEVSPGHVLVIPRWNWHPISNVGTVDVAAPTSEARGELGTDPGGQHGNGGSSRWVRRRRRRWKLTGGHRFRLACSISNCCSFTIV
jgi:hypothetical protein